MPLSAEKTLENHTSEAEVVTLNLKPTVGYCRTRLLRLIFKNLFLGNMIGDPRYWVKLLRSILIC